MNNLVFKSPIFKGVDPEDIMNLSRVHHFTTMKFKKEDIIALAGESVDYLMIVSMGCVRGEMIDAAGKVFRVEDIEAPRAVAPAFLFGPENKFPVNVIAECDCELLYIPKSELHIIFHKNNKIMLNFIEAISARVHFLTKKIKGIFLQTIKGKIAEYLITLADQVDGNEIVLNKGQSWLAEKFGVTRPSVGRVFSEFVQNGIIEMEGKKIKIVDREKLKNCRNAV